MSGDNQVRSGTPTPHEGTAPHSAESTDVAEGAPGQRQVIQVTLEEVVRPLAIAGMLTCIAISLSQLVAAYAPEWPGSFFVLLTFAVCLESISAQRLLTRRRLRGQDRFRFRFVEVVVILLLMRFGVYLHYGPARLTADMSSWSTDLGTFFDLGFLANSFLIAIFWFVASHLSQAMQMLEAAPIEKMPAVTDPNFYLRSTMPHHGRTDRQAQLGRIVGIFFGGGVILLLLTALSRVDVQDLVVLQHSRSSGIILNALAYFVIGLLLISQAQYTILKANWELQDIPLLGSLGRRWLLMVLGFLLLLGAVSALLPVGYSVGIIEAISSAVHWLIYFILQVVFLVLFVVSLIFGLLMRLFSGGAQNSPPPTLEQPPPPVPPQALAQGPAAWWLVARSLIFWAILTGVIGYSLYHFAIDRWGLFRGFAAGRFFAWVGRGWRQMLRNTRRAAARLRQQIAARLAARQARMERSVWRYLALGRLSPRERVRYFYLSTLRRSAQQGYGRPPGITPLQYEGTLARQMPEVGEQVHELTQAFVEARYSEHSISAGDASAVQRIFRAVRRALTARRRK